MRKSFRLIFLLVLGTAFFIGGFQTAWAQEDEFMLEEIMVTAQKREENVQDVPVAITVANREQIERQQISSITDLARITPALEFSNPGQQGPGGGGQIRGIGTVTFSPTAVGSVAVVIDEVPAGEIPNPNVFDVERVEVLRGPQGTLFGQAASAGVINMVTVAPDLTTVSGNIHIEYADKGTFGSRIGQQQIKGALNVPLSENSAMRISALANNYIGVQKNLYDDEDAEDKNYGVRARFRYSPNDDLDVNFIADFNKQDQEGPNTFTLIDVVPGTGSAESAANGGITVEEGNQDVYYPINPSKESDNYGLSAQIDYTISNHILTSITAYRDQEQTADEVVFPYPEPFHLIIENFDKNTDADQFSQEFRITSPGGKTVEYVAGLFYSTFNKEMYGPGATVMLYNPPFVPFPVGYFPVSVGGGSDFETANDSMAAYGQMTYNVSENAALFAGLRLTQQEVEIIQTEHHTGAVGSLTEDDDNLSWRIGGQYRFNPQLMAYGSITQGYKPMQLAEGSPDETGTILDMPAIIKAEEPLSFEAGFKSSLMDNRMAFDINVYHNTVDNYQGELCSTTDTGTWVCVPTNVSEVVAKGFEIDLMGRPLPGLSLTSGLIYVSAEYPDGFLDEDGTDISGEQLNNVPEWKFVLSGDYTHGLTDNIDGYLALNGTYRTEFQTGNPIAIEKTMVDGYWDLGAQIGVRSIHNTWGVTLWGRNLLNEHAHYFAVTESDGETNAIYGTKSFRMVGISMHYRF